MNLSDLTTAIAADAGISRDAARKAIDSFREHLGAALRCGEEVRLADFGTFTRVYRESAPGRNPRTGEAIDVPGMHRVKFVPASALRQRIQEHAA